MKRINLLFKPASSLCNMRCRYCFYHDISADRDIPSYGIMLPETQDKTLDNVFSCLEPGDEITIGFQGGEPALAGLQWFRDFAEKVRALKGGVKVSYTFQTNGTLLDESWCDFFKEHNFLVGLSIDGGKRFHDQNRLTNSGEPTFEKCMKAKELFLKMQVEYNILCVLTNDLAREPEKVWRFILHEHIRFIQFIPCLADLGSRDEKTPLRPALFAQFYTRLLALWIREFEKGNYISVKLFDDTVNYFYKGMRTSCGIDGKCQNQFVIEADASVYPCDFYCSDEYRIGNLMTHNIRELFDNQEALGFLNEKPELSEICETCRHVTKCQGGCKRMQGIMYALRGDPICGYGSFLEKCLGPLVHTVQRALVKK